MMSTYKHMHGKMIKSILRFASYYPQVEFGYSNSVPTTSMSVKPPCYTADIALAPS